MALHQPYEPYYISQPYTAFSNDGNGINTLFVSGLPDDVLPREIHNLFRRRPGFDFCQLKYTGRGNQVVAFATFVNHQSAMAALHALNGAKFDPQTGSTLHIELARSNSRRKHTPGSEAYIVIDNRNKSSVAAHETSSEEGGSESDESSESKKDKSDDKLLSPKTENDEVEDGETALHAEKREKATDDDQGCSTLFIANLGPKCTEDELKRVLSQYPGFNMLKVRAKGGMPVAFADFTEIQRARDCMNALQGSTLPSSDRGGMHIEYARSKMRKRP